jgi:hypothetical protein
VEERLIANSRLPREARFRAALGQRANREVLNGDPAHKMVNPVRCRLEEAMALGLVTAPVLWVWGDGRGYANG